MKVVLVRANVFGLVGAVLDDRLGEVESAAAVAAVIVLLVMVLHLCDVGSLALVVAVILWV